LEAGQGAPIAHTAAVGPYDPNDAAAVTKAKFLPQLGPIATRAEKSESFADLLGHSLLKGALKGAAYEQTT
jgi:hypothetical protein